MNYLPGELIFNAGSLITEQRKKKAQVQILRLGECIRLHAGCKQHGHSARLRTAKF